MRQIADTGRAATTRERLEDVECPIDRLNRRPARCRPTALLRQADRSFREQNRFCKPAPLPPSRGLSRGHLPPPYVEPRALSEPRQRWEGMIAGNARAILNLAASPGPAHLGFASRSRMARAEETHDAAARTGALDRLTGRCRDHDVHRDGVLLEPLHAAADGVIRLVQHPGFER